MGNSTFTWTESQDLFLKENYGKLSAKEISVKIGRSASAIAQRALKLKINKVSYKFWTHEELNNLKIQYPMIKRIFLEKFFGRSWLDIKAKANELKLKRLQKNQDLIQGDCSKLLLNTPETFYWIGFLLADGHFSNLGRLQLTLAIKDENHMLKFCEFLKCNYFKDLRKASCSILDKYYINLVKQKFDISNQKTYCPPDFSLYNFDQNLLLSLITGFIDGDGHIRYQSRRKDFILTIKCHSTWLPFFFWIKEQFNKSFNIDSGYPKINNCGYSRINFANHNLLLKLKRKVIELNLPVLSRKWDIINNYVQLSN